MDTLGFPFFTHCTRANLSDDAGLIEMLTQNIDYFKSKPVNIPKITALVPLYGKARKIVCIKLEGISYREYLRPRYSSFDNS